MRTRKPRFPDPETAIEPSQIEKELSSEILSAIAQPSASTNKPAKTKVKDRKAPKKPVSDELIAEVVSQEIVPLNPARVPGATGNYKGAIETAEARRIQIFGLRKSGASYRQIAKQLSINVATAFNAVSLTMQELKHEALANAGEYRELELTRLDQLQLNIWSQAVGGNLKAVETVIKLMDHRAKLLGLYAPTLTQSQTQTQTISQTTIDVSLETKEITNDRVSELRSAVMQYLSLGENNGLPSGMGTESGS